MCWRVPVCTHVFTVWLYKPGESRELSEGGCPGFLSKKDEHLLHNLRCNLLDCSREKITIRKSSQTSEIHHQSQTKKIWSDNTETNQHLCLFFFLLCTFTINQTMWLFSPHLMGSSHCDKRIKTLPYTHFSFLEAVCFAVLPPELSPPADGFSISRAQPPWASLNELGRPE